MGKFLFAVIFGSFALLSAYVAIALLTGPKAEARIVKILGPGSNPKVCASRARLYLEPNKNVMESIASALLASDHLTDVWVTRSRDDLGFHALRNGYEWVEPTQEDIETYFPQFERLNLDSYYTPNFFSQREGSVVVASVNATCGQSIFDWVKFRLGRGSVEDKPAAIAAAFTYWPNGIPEFEECKDPSALKPNEVMGCEIPLNENWAWLTEWAIFESFMKE